MNISIEQLERVNQLFQELRNNLNGISDYCNLKNIPETINYQKKEYPIDLIEKWATEGANQISELENLFDILLNKNNILINRATLDNCLTAELPISTYLKYFSRERIEKIEFTPLIESKESCMNKYDIDWRIYKWEDRLELLFKFFSFNIGEKVEVGVIYGFANCILEKATFVVGGRIETEWIKPNEIIENGYCYNYFNFKNIYYAKVITE